HPYRWNRMRDGAHPGRLDLVDRAAHADGVDLRRGGERADRDRKVVAAAGTVDHVGEQEGAPLALGEAGLEMPAHPRMQRGVLVDRTVDADQQPLRIERGEMGLEVERRGAARLRGPARIWADIEHGALRSRLHCDAAGVWFVAALRNSGVSRAWARSSSAP